MMAARWLVLFPGAAQASRTWLPVGGFRRYAGRQLACWDIRETVVDMQVHGPCLKCILASFFYQNRSYKVTSSNHVQISDDLKEGRTHLESSPCLVEWCGQPCTDCGHGSLSLERKPAGLKGAGHPQRISPSDSGHRAWTSETRIPFTSCQPQSIE